MPYKNYDDYQKALNKYNNELTVLTEEWRPLDAFDIAPIYKVSNHGHIMTNNGEMKYPTNNGRGYSVINLQNKNGNRKRYLVHRIVGAVFIKIPEKYLEMTHTIDSLQINHINGIKHLNAVFNLEWCTCKENVQHAHKTGLAWKSYGENNFNAKYAHYSDDIIHQICQYIEENRSNEYIKEHVDVSDSFIYILARGDTFKHITSLYDMKPRTKSLSDEEIHNICKDLMKRDLGVYKIAEKYELSVDYVYALINGEYRIDITSQYNLLSIIKKRLTDDVVHAICKDIVDAILSYSAIAKKYNVTKSCVAGIRNHRIRKDISQYYNF